jgi:hypothetical protein
MGKNQYVVRSGRSWAVRGEGNSRLTKTFETQQEAIDYARPIARGQKSELRIQDTQGQFRQAWSYGSDPNPQKG